MFVARWGTGQGLAAFFPSVAGDPGLTELFARYERNSARPGDVEAIIAMCAEIDRPAGAPDDHGADARRPPCR